MSFLASSTSSVAGGPTAATGPSFQFLTSADKEKLAEFETFRTAFATAKVSKLARHDLKLSTVDPVPYLNKAYYKPAKPFVDAR